MNPLHILIVGSESKNLWSFFTTSLFTHFLTIIMVLLGLLIVNSLLKEKHSPSYTFAWVLLIVFLPPVGIPLYFLFGGRKSNKVLRNKKEVQKVAAKIAGTPSAKISQSEWVGNAFTLLHNGIEAYEAFCHQIMSAQKSIYIMSYILGNDATGRHLIELLTQKVNEGVEVKLLLDALGSFGKIASVTRPLREAGGDVARFMPVLPFQTKTSANLRNHRKIALFDSQKAIIGGHNLDARFLRPQGDTKLFHDFSALIEGPGIEGLKRIFISDWCFATQENPKNYQEALVCRAKKAGKHPINIIASGPDSEEDPLWEQLVTLIQECQQKITIVTPYFIPDQVLFHSLMIKARKNHEIELIVPKKSNHPLVDFARNHYLRQLHKAGAKIRLYEAGMLHGKLFLVDNQIAMIGSANIDVRSLFVNFEIGIMLKTQKPILALKTWIKNTVHPYCLPYEQSKEAKVGPNRRLIEDFAHLLIPLL